VKSEFPIVGIIGAGHIARMMIAPATSLGIKLLPFASDSSESAAQVTQCVIGDYTDIEAVKKFAKQCDVLTFEHDQVPLSIIKTLEVAGVRVRPSSETFEESRAIVSSIQSRDFDYEVAVLVARSPHAQATTWTPTQVIQSADICMSTISPAPQINTEMREHVQKIALDTAAQIKLIGVMEVRLRIKSDNIFVHNLVLLPNISGHWTIDGSRTSQFEQHLRAILDLPLGDPTITSDYVVMGNIVGSGKTDMYRPYLHLMARNPSLKFHMYAKQVLPGVEIGHVNAMGNDLAELRSEIEHAIDYISGEIDE
jgi:5-(carboxyamino)imidazole ribonucleotide synthase